MLVTNKVIYSNLFNTLLVCAADLPGLCAGERDALNTQKRRRNRRQSPINTQKSPVSPRKTPFITPGSPKRTQ